MNERENKREIARKKKRACERESGKKGASKEARVGEMQMESRERERESERERERERDREKERKREREKERGEKEKTERGKKRERARERHFERERERERKSEREKESARARERERERESKKERARNWSKHRKALPVPYILGSAPRKSDVSFAASAASVSLRLSISRDNADCRIHSHAQIDVREGTKKTMQYQRVCEPLYWIQIVRV